MKTEQSISNQNSVETKAQPQQINLTRNKLFVIVASSVLLTAIITGFSVYFWQESVGDKASRSLEQKIVSLEKQVSTINKGKVASQPTSAPELFPSQVTDPTANWKTYVDNDLNYLIKYPSGFNFKEKAPNAKYIVISKPGGEVEGTEALSHFTIAIKEGPKVDNLGNAVLHFQEQSRQISSEDMQFTSTIEKVFNGANSLYYYQEGPIGYQQNFVLLNKNQRLIHINVIFANAEVQKNEQNEVDQLLSTFKLTN